MTRRRQAAMVIGIFVCLVVADTALMARRHWFPNDQVAGRESLWPADVVRRLTLGYDGVAADLYWIRAVQHFGRERRRPPTADRYAQLYPLIDRATDLDPLFTAAYEFGALLLAEPLPAGAGRLDLAVALLEKGRRAAPHRWQFAQYLGIVHYWHGPDRRVAGRYFSEAAAVPGAPDWLKPLAATAFVEGGDAASARVVLRALLQHEQPWLRELAERRLLELEGR